MCKTEIFNEVHKGFYCEECREDFRFCEICGIAVCECTGYEYDQYGVHVYEDPIMCKPCMVKAKKEGWR